MMNRRVAEYEKMEKALKKALQEAKKGEVTVLEQEKELRFETVSISKSKLKFVYPKHRLGTSNCRIDPDSCLIYSDRARRAETRNRVGFLSVTLGSSKLQILPCFQ